MQYAIVEDGIVTNVIVLYPQGAAEFPYAVACRDIPVTIGDTWDGKDFTRDGEKVPTEADQLRQSVEDKQASLEVLGVGTELAEVQLAKPYLVKAAQMLDDSDSLKVLGIYPTWEELVTLGSVTSEVGYKFTYKGDLYKCIQPNPGFQASWVPGQGTESLYARIDETHAGTLNDPIPYEGNMALVNGLYYSQSGVVYKCIRDTVNPVYHALSDLVGLYVEVAA